MLSTHRLLRPVALLALLLTAGCEVIENARDRFARTDTVSTVAGSGLTLGLQAPSNVRPGEEAVLRISVTNRTDSVVSNVRLQLIVPAWAEPLPPRPGEPPVTMAAMTDGTTVFTYGLDDRPLQPNQAQTVEQRIRVPAAATVPDSTAPWTNSVRAVLLSAAGDPLAEVESQIGPDSIAGSSAGDTIARRDRLGAARLGMSAATLKAGAASARDTVWSAGGTQQRGLVVPVGSGTALAVLERDAVARIEVGSESVRTAEGLGIGSTVQELRGAYGTACANVVDGRPIVWFPDAPGIVFALDATGLNAAQLRADPERLPGTARVTRWWLRQGGESCAG